MAENLEPRSFQGLDWSPSKRSGDVALRFWTYAGFLVFFNETEYRLFLPPSDARTLLKRLHHHNLVWGWFCPGALFIPLVSIGNYYGQLRSISRQETSEWEPAWVDETKPVVDDLSKFIVGLSLITFFVPIFGLGLGYAAFVCTRKKKTTWRKLALCSFIAALVVHGLFAVIMVIGTIAAGTMAK